MRNLGNLEVIRISKVSSNDSVPLIYLPKKAVERIGLRKGDYVVLATDGRRLIIEKLELNSQGG
ncbi:MAG: AbrB/MazE/SpoVT family DNA-binding domain-containing protein [archaeon GB-1867-005]|nr:AbrB/MazE/SpoVT family DNA-binding domain-containing protein [Candidatus Culexmicrobium cathedralense]